MIDFLLRTPSAVVPDWTITNNAPSKQNYRGVVRTGTGTCVSKIVNYPPHALGRHPLNIITKEVL